ncbi:helix-turn-helix transcriptional regulator [Umezawaea beigongshangensis]|uniref:helix-turn-helix transcriptional regulator n=1 Tax=Umezawaea beigongshangensis TaxID=2780383 RepID=UPI0018F20CFD|nr:LuxR family transcriptional regulator [Umezawaea beigongshangensis]
MVTGVHGVPVGAALRGRGAELALLRGAVDAARAARGSAHVVRGGPGSGRTALLDAATALAEGFTVLSTAGAPTETAVPLSGLHRLLQPLADRIETHSWSHPGLLAVAAGHRAGPAADPFALSAAVHRLLTVSARERPLLLRVDDADLLDSTSLEVLVFCARRLVAEPAVLLFATDVAEVRGAADPLAGLPGLHLAPLRKAAARLLLADLISPPPPDDLADDLVDLACGSPGALVDLARALTPAQLCGREPAPGALPRHSALRARLTARFDALSAGARAIVLLAVVDDRLGLDEAVAASGADLAALDEARCRGLLDVDGDRVTVPGELVRSTLEAHAPLADRAEAHARLARTLDRSAQRVRRLWHRAATATGPHDDLADDLAAEAAAARSSNDWATSSRSFWRSAALTSDQHARAARLLSAAADCWRDGGTSRSRTLLRRIRPLATARDLRGLADLVGGGIELGDGAPAQARRLLLDAAHRLEPTHRALGATALVFAAEAGDIAGDHLGYLDVARRAARWRRAGDPPETALMLDHVEGVAAMLDGRHGDALAPLRRVVATAAGRVGTTSLIWASHAAWALGDGDRAHGLATRAVGSARQGITALVPWSLLHLAHAALLIDRHAAAAAASAEGMRAARAVGQRNCALSHAAVLAVLAASLGDRDTALHRTSAAADGVARGGLGKLGALASWALAVVDLLDDRPADALNRLRLMAVGTGPVHAAVRVMAVPHFVEAALGCGERDAALRALEHYEAWSDGTGSAARRALAHRCRGLLAQRPGVADEHFAEAVRLHRASGTALELAKTELFHAQRLRRDRKPGAARVLLTEAVRIFERYDAARWAAKARAELRAAGAPGDGPPRSTGGDLTPQQAQIARSAALGATNREIAAQLFLSPRTVEHHLRNVFAKLDVRSRVELARILD